MTLTSDERTKATGLPTVQRIAGGVDLSSRPYDAGVRDVLLESILASGSNVVLLPIQDVFGWSDRINEPAKVDDQNWTYRLPWPSDRLDDVPEARERQRRLRAWAEQYDRV